MDLGLPAHILAICTRVTCMRVDEPLPPHVSAFTH
jgi:hypothetical protein